MAEQELQPLTFDEIFGLIRSDDVDDRLDGLTELCDVVESAYWSVLPSIELTFTIFGAAIS